MDINKQKEIDDFLIKDTEEWLRDALGDEAVIQVGIERYNKNNEKNKIDELKLNSKVDIKEWPECPFDKEMIAIINILNEYGIKTKQCCSGHNKHQAQISIDLTKNNINFEVMDNRLIIQWDMDKEIFN